MFQELLSNLLLPLCQCVPHEVVCKRCHECTLLAVRRPPMSPLNVLVVVNRPIPLLAFLLCDVPQLLDHLPRVGRMDPVVPRARGYEHRGVLLHLPVDLVVRRVPLEEFPIVGVRISVLRHPRRPGQERVVPLHVQKGHRAVDRPEQVRPHHIHVPHQQAAVGPSPDRQGFRPAQARLDQSLRHGDEILVGLVPVLLEGRLVPLGTEFAASADVGLHVGAAALQPGDAGGGDVLGSEGDLEPSVAVEESGGVAVEDGVLFGNEEVRDLRAVLADGGPLGHG
mmetsp:Transcript_7031/g.14750  ORF Transcript_7031/g.14750 Transcript_7031/m.14750 type:complete len:281 (+) Transcript_7031:171-1013(+)